MKKISLIVLMIMLLFVTGCESKESKKEENEISEREIKKELVRIAKEMVNSAARNLTSEEYEIPMASNDVTIITADRLIYDKNDEIVLLKPKSYVAIVNKGDEINPYYNYYVAVEEKRGYAIPLTSADEIDKDDVVEAKDKMEVTIQSLCGTEEGEYATIANISGLELKDARTGWNAYIYSSKSCGK